MTSVEDRLSELLQAAAPESQGVAFDAVRGEVRRRRTAQWSIAASIVAVAVVATALIVPMSGDRHHVNVTTTTTPTPTVNLTGTVPWTDAPLPTYQPPPTPATTPPASDARPCTATDVSVAPGDRNGAGGHQLILVRFRNISSSTCVLKGYPRVTATEPGRPDVTATDGSFFPSTGTADMRPGQDTYLGVETDAYCNARPGGGPTGPLYHHLDIALPGGGTVAVAFDGARAALDAGCGLHLTRFFVQQAEPPVDPHDPLSDLVVSLEVPDRVRAGSTLTYIANITNPTDRAISLDRCPGYIEATTPPSMSVKETYALNCAPVGAIAAHSTVRFEMRLPVPAQMAAGPFTFEWSLAGPLSVVSDATVTVTS